MTPGAGFLVSFGLTLVTLAIVFATGLRAKRRWHVVSVLATVASLGATVYFAKQLAFVYDLDAAGWITPLHLALARVNTFAFLLPIATGVRTVFVPRTRRFHKQIAFIVLGMTIVTAATGGIMLWLAPRLA